MQFTFPYLLILLLLRVVGDVFVEHERPVAGTVCPPPPVVRDAHNKHTLNEGREIQLGKVQ